MTKEELMLKYPWTKTIIDVVITIAYQYVGRFDDETWDALNKSALPKFLDSDTTTGADLRHLLGRIYCLVCTEDFKALQQQNKTRWLEQLHLFVDMGIKQTPLTRKEIIKNYPWMEEFPLIAFAERFSRAQLMVINEFNLSRFLKKDAFSVFYVGSILSKIQELVNTKPVHTGIVNGHFLFKDVVKEVVAAHESQLDAITNLKLE